MNMDGGTSIKIMGSLVRHLLILLSMLLIINHHKYMADAISIKPADFDRLIMPCYLGGSSSYQQSSYSQPIPPSNGSPAVPSSYTQLGRITAQGISMASNGNNFQSSSSYYGSNTQGREASDNLGQQVPRANTIDNFIALLTKIEAASPRLANNPDQLIRVLLNRFRMDNYYYDVRSKIPISEQDLRTQNIIPALLGTYEQLSNFFGQTDEERFSEYILSQDEKCSMYFMLSHFIDKGTPMNLPLASVPVPQMSGPQYGIKPPNLQAAGSGYPAVSANNAYSGAGVRYPGPAPSFGSPATNNMNSFGSGMTNNRDYSSSNPYGMNVIQPNNQLNINYNNMRNSGPYSGTPTSNFRQTSPVIDGGARSDRDQHALERGVVALQGQENAAIVLNRVLLGILAATAPQRTIRQLAEVIFPTQSLTPTSRIDNDIDPLFAVTLADLWAVSSIPKNGKPFDLRTLGDNGKWNDTMCQTSFHLERASSIRFTTAELLGGLDGFNLGMFRRELINLRKSVRLSDMFRMYYSKTGFKNQFAEVGVCNRVLALNNHIDTLRRQAEDYSRLYQLNLPINDNEIASSISRLDSFKELVRQSSNQYTPQDICQESSYDGFSLNMQDQCEVAKADIVTILDTSPQANDAFMRLSVIRLAQKLGLSRSSNSLTILTNQQDITGSSNGNGLNSIVSNSTNTGEIGCALMHDTSRSYSGGQISEATKLIEMFEKALINLDTEYLARQSLSHSSNKDQSSSSYGSSWFGSSEGSRPSYQDMDYSSGRFGGGKSTGGAKVIIWFNFGQQMRMNSLSSYPTNMHTSQDQNNYRFQEAKKYLRENFRGASILAVGANRDDVKAFVYDEDKDIITDIPTGSSSPANEYYPSLNLDSFSASGLRGSVDQLVGKLLQRMCDIPALFQYPMCFKNPSDNMVSIGYISPQKKQHWMMSPKTFFASQSVRMAFRVEGGRLRVCFGRKPRPDESAQKKGQIIESGSIYLTSSDNRNSPSTPAPSYGDNLYTGADYGICKDVSAGQEVDFIVDSPCYRTSIADCDPFYFVIKEISNPGETDPNYMCKDDGCKRFDQVKFTMRHTGVSCNSATSSSVNIFLIMISAIITWCFAGSVGLPSQEQKVLRATKWGYSSMIVSMAAFVYMGVQQVHAQQAGVHDFGQGRYGEKRGNFTPAEVLSIILIIMVILGGLALTIGFCYYVSKQSTRGRTRVEQNDY